MALAVSAATALAMTATPAAAATRSSIVDIAEREMADAQRNIERPAGSNCNYYTGVFREWKPSSGCGSADGVQFRDSDWCADFSKYVWRAAGVTHADIAELNGGVLTGWAASFKDYGTKYGTWHTRASGYTPLPGDAVVFDWDQSGDIDHVGIVTSANSSTITTIEGNSSDRIKANSYSRGNVDIVGYSAPLGITPDLPPPSVPPAGDSGVRADFNGDGRDDVAGFYDYGDASAALWVWTAGQDGSLQAPVRAWESGTWDATRTKLVGGDFNGDGRGDVGALYDYGDASAALWVWTAGQGGAFQAPVRVWQSGTWDATRTKLVGGDFNGDGRDDVAGFYDYGDASAALWVWTAGQDGSLQAPVRAWESGTWDATRTKLVGGDFNGDGRGDVGALYDYGDASAALWVWTAGQDGSLQAPVRAWESGTWDATRTKLVGGDFNGDGRDDVGALYDYGNASSALWSWSATSTGTLQAPVRVWQSGTWDAARTKLVGGDFNGDGRDDVGALYDYGNASSALWSWSATSTGTLQAPVRVWQSGTWDATRTKLL
ncbi:FG-GAP-like repeat-containing protein [Sphaerisporangium sp. B11E5]|uniref:CHAP domain-containing protein n=1 Tax=Sphaerisporangium sp. B11E5 TaxID=3153563 RepID=UPI00325F4F50